MKFGLIRFIPERYRPIILVISGAFAVIATAGGVWSTVDLFNNYFLKERVVTSILLRNPVHLGDNYHARIGGDISRAPNPSNCHHNIPSHVSIICWDKELGAVTNSAISTPVVNILQKIALPNIFNVNIDAWRHIVAVSSNELSSEEVDRAIWFDGSAKIWRARVPHNKRYYAQVAPFVISFQLSAFEAITNAGYDIDSLTSTKMVFSVEGLTGGRREDQEDRLFVFLNKEIRPVHFPTLRTRDTRKIDFHFELDAEILRKGKPLHFGIFVLPWQEEGPKPPSLTNVDQRGPAHFQDVDVNRVIAKFILN